MKSKRKNPSSRRRKRLLRHPVRQFFRLTGFTLSLAVLLTLIALLTFGLPDSLTRRITAKIQDAGIPIQIQSIRLSIHRGLILNNARLYSRSPDDLQPLLNAKKIVLMLWPMDWRNPANGGWNIRVAANTLDVSLGNAWEQTLRETHPFRSINQLNATLTATPGHIAIENASMQWGGIEILSRGTIRFSPAALNDNWPGSLKQAADSIRTQDPDVRWRIARTINTLSQLQCKKSPQLNLSFQLNQLHPEASFLEAVLSAEGVTWKDRIYQKISGTFGYRDRIWTLTALHLDRTNEQQLVLHGAFNLNSSNVQISVENSLSAADLFSLLPETAQSAVAQTGIKPYGRFDFTLASGPAPLDQLKKAFDLQVQQVQLTRQNITLDPLSFRLRREGSQLKATEIQTRINGEPLTAALEYHLDTGAWNASLQARCDPSPAGSFGGSDLEEFMGRFTFSNQWPKAELMLSQAGANAPFYMKGSVTGDNFTCAGIPIAHLETQMVYSNEVLYLRPMHIVRDAYQFDGDIQVDFIHNLALFNVTNSFPPAEISQVLAPGMKTILNEIHIDGPLFSVGSGRIDYNTWTHHDFSGAFRVKTVELGGVQASDVRADISGLGDQLSLTNASMKLYGGSAHGSAVFDIFLPDGPAPYRINARLESLNLAKMLKDLFHMEPGRTRGQLSTDITLTADANQPFWASVKGHGQINIRDGYLADLPLFGGFSRLVQSAIPGFNLFSLTSFSADFTLHDAAVWSDNAQLGGSVFSTRGQGSFSPETGLNFIAAVEPLQQIKNDEWNELHSWTAAALKLSTQPFFLLLKFQLTGPLDKPEWRFVNLPQ